jgi:hypothetical protein
MDAMSHLTQPGWRSRWRPPTPSNAPAPPRGTRGTGPHPAAPRPRRARAPATRNRGPHASHEAASVAPAPRRARSSLDGPPIDHRDRRAQPLEPRRRPPPRPRAHDAGEPYPSTVAQAQPPRVSATARESFAGGRRGLSDFGTSNVPERAGSTARGLAVCIENFGTPSHDAGWPRSAIRPRLRRRGRASDRGRKAPDGRPTWVD